VSLFKRLLNFPREALKRMRDKRKAARYATGPDFLLEASISLIGSDSLVRIRSAQGQGGCYWGGRVADLSSTGLRVQLPQAAITIRGEVTLVTLTIAGHSLQLPCEVAHFRVYNSYSLAGLKLHIGDEATQRSYLQLLEIIATGATFAPAKPVQRPRAAPGLEFEAYVADNRTQLAVWRPGKGAKPVACELLFGDYCIRGEAGRPTLEVYTRQRDPSAGKTAFSAPAFGLSDGTHTEARQYFRWVVLNAGKKVPPEVRQFLAKYSR